MELIEGTRSARQDGHPPWLGHYQDILLGIHRRNPKLPSPIPFEIVLNESQAERFREADAELDRSIAAHEQMRNLINPQEWRPGSSLPTEFTIEGEVRKLEDDIRKFAITALNLRAEALWVLNSFESFRERFSIDTRSVLEWAFAKISPQDVSILNRTSLEMAINDQVNVWINKARQAFPDPWLSNNASGSESPQAGDIANQQNRSPKAPVADNGVGHESSQVNAGMARQESSWENLRSEFLQHATEHADLRAVWQWAFEDTDESVVQSIPKGQWLLKDGTPASQHLFRVVAGAAARHLTEHTDSEPWRLWLDRMLAEGYARDLPTRRATMQQIRNWGAAGLLGPPLPPGFKSQHIENVFKCSADFCQVMLLSEANAFWHSPTSEQRAKGQVEVTERSPGETTDPPEGDLVGLRAAKRQRFVNPILEGKRWKPGRLATEAGIGKNSVYEYLDGTRAKITEENRQALADALGVRPEELPE